MKHLSRNLRLGALAILFCLFTANAFAADDPPPLADAWSFTIKTGEMGAFMDALKSHMKVRKENGDPRGWNVYTPRVGDDLDTVTIRFCCVDWADMDSYDGWNSDNPAVLEDWYAGPGKHVASVKHRFSKIDWPNSHWSDEDGPYSLFYVTEWNVKAEASMEFDAARKKMSQIAINQGWASPDRSWIWGESIGGPARAFIVTPHSNFADIGDNDESFFRFLSEQMGSEAAAAELLKQFSGSTWGSTVTIWQHRPELSLSE